MSCFNKKVSISMAYKCKWFRMLTAFLLLIGNLMFAQCPTVTNLNQSFCDIQSPTVANLQAINNGGGIAWFATDISTTPLPIGTGLINGEDYFADNSTGNCGTRIRVVVTVYSAPTGQNFQGVCVDFPSQATIASLIAVGNNVQWYNVPVGGSPLPSTTVLIPNTIYYANQTNPDTGCLTSRLSVFVSVGVVPVPTGSAIQIFCENPSNPPTVANLNATGNNNWYLTSTSALPLDIDTPLINGQTYYATTVDPPCESLERLEVTVTIQPFNNAGINDVFDICETELLTTAPINLFDILGGTPFSSGVWSGPFLTSNGNLGTIDVSLLTLAGSPYVFTYTVSESTECPIATSTVTINVIATKNAGTSGSITLCTTSPSIDLFTLLGNSPETGGTWSPVLASGTGLFDPSVDTAGTYTYTIVGTPPCADSTATVAVTIDLAANAGVFTGIQIICNSTGNFDLNTLLDGTQQAGGVWVNGQGDTITNIISVTDLIAGTYTFVYTVTNTCNSDSEVVQLTIIQSPNITIDDVIVLTPICQGESTTITVFNLANGNYSINYSLTGSNILANQTVLLTVTDGEGSFTIDSTQLVNSGITTLILNSITNSVTTCTTVLSGLNFAIEVLPIPSISNSTIQIVNVCFGNDVLVQISGATNLTDGNYQFVYSIPNANPIIGNSGIISIVSGNGQFAITATVFPLAGVYTMSLISISNLATNCTNLNPNVAVTFEILAQPTITEALVSMAGICVNTEGTVLITNANNLSDGTYQLTYQISGAINFNETIPVVFTNGETSFVIPSSVTNNFGNITISINPINSNTGNACGFSGHTFNTVTIAIEEVETPQLIEGGNSFCEDDNSTIADLTNGIIGSETIIWYDAPSSGNAYSNSDLLVDGVTYYASIQSASGCESAVRLQVTVVIKDCTDIIIPDGFSPNGDGINEIFVINNIRTLYPNFTLEIFNRYGNILYKGNANSLDWDGTSDKGIQIGGNKLPVGVYFYVINFNDGSRKPLQGRVYLSR